MLTDTINQNWSGSGDAPPLFSTTTVTGSVDEDLSTSVNAATTNQAEQFQIGHALLQELWAQSDQNVTLSVNLAMFTFTVTSANATVGATYTHNGITFTVLATISAGTTLLCSANHTTGAPLASGTLTKASGSGDATITFTAISAPTVPWYVFTATSANATVGAVYSDGINSYTVLATISAGTTLLCSGKNGAVPSGSTLTKSSGTGDATITFSGASYALLVLSLLGGVPYIWLATGYAANPFSADLATFYFTNAGSTTANPSARALRT